MHFSFNTSLRASIKGLTGWLRPVYKNKKLGMANQEVGDTHYHLEKRSIIAKALIVGVALDNGDSTEYKTDREPNHQGTEVVVGQHIKQRARHG